MFAQESVMGINKEREDFEAEFSKIKSDIAFWLHTWDEEMQGYNHPVMCWFWYMWQAAKAQAVPDVQQALNDRLLVRSIKKKVESHIAEISVNDLFDKGWFAAMKCIQSNIDMLEAREPTYD